MKTVKLILKELVQPYVLGCLLGAFIVPMFSFSITYGPDIIDKLLKDEKKIEWQWQQMTPTSYKTFGGSRYHII